ncbi:MAG: hypothetical protein E7052_01265 [Lentisphaerae bacterium]|nr:hypothetical protein [Lentisphaerota bacterium]
MNSFSGNNYLKCGLSLNAVDREQLAAYSNLPDCVEFLELSGELVLDAAELRNELPWLQELEILHFRNLISASLSSMLTPENQVIVPDYKRQLRELFACANRCGAAWVGVDPDWEVLYHDPQRREIFNDVLRSTAGDREYYDLKMTLPVRIPGSGQTAISNSLKLLYKLNNYRVDLALDIHPHELLNSQVDWEKLLHSFRFDTACIRFCYESDLGNKLLFRHIEPVIKTVKQWKRPLCIAIAPGRQLDHAGLSELIKAVNGESSEV